MSEQNGAEPRQTPPIKYPVVTIPGKGTFVVKFGLGASITLEDELGMDQQAFGRKLGEWFPKKTESGEEVPGRVSPAFLFKVLSACIWDQAQLTPRQIADAFEASAPESGIFDHIAPIAKIVAEAFSKTRWSAQIRLQEPATPNQEHPALPN